MFWNRVFFVLTPLVLSAACDRLPLHGDAPQAEPLQDIELLSSVDIAEDVAPPQIMASPQSQSPFAGLLGRLRGVDPAPATAQDATRAAMPLEPEKPTEPLTSGFFDFLRGSPENSTPAIPAGFGAEVSDVPPLSDLTFGVVERTCGLSRGDLGQEITAASGFRVYDTNPGSTAMRPHYVTGFDDGCARQFSAALVLLGDVGTHELVRYSKTRVALEYSATDTAYEAIKSRFCGVGKGEPCGPRLEQLGKVTTFVTAYRSFGAAPDWAEFLLYDGDVAAVDLEGL